MRSVQIAQGTGPRPARVTARPACSRRRRRGARGRDLGGYGKRRELRRELPAVALRTLRLLVAIHQRFKRMIAFLADVLEDRHLIGSRRHRGTNSRLYLKSECGRHANPLSTFHLRAAPLPARRPPADSGWILPHAQHPSAPARRALCRGCPRRKDALSLPLATPSSHRPDADPRAWTGRL